MKHMVGCEVSNSLPSTSFRYKTKAEKLFWGSGCEIRRRNSCIGNRFWKCANRNNYFNRKLQKQLIF